MSNWRFGNKKRAKLFIRRKMLKHNLANLQKKNKEIQELGNDDSNNVTEISNNQSINTSNHSNEHDDNR
ncbi:unnamed protein product [Macrosiphum euphorbiae]|uniref:Uncharacterized protein n=1 Tax=Macrosiphum euphorbiae TaxID=13131 RepID=A0AAV0WW49_9HEMI|nr:unnamed protein product [Macrosiphum euphorbiae]